MARVLLVQPSLQPPGGGNGVAAWMLQALAAEHRVTVLSWRPVDVDSINRFFGTALRAPDFDTLVIPRGWRLAPDALPVPAALLRSAMLMRYTRRVSEGFDVIAGVHNEADYGRRGIQYVHYPTYLRPRPKVDLRWYHASSPLLESYYRFTDRVADFSVERMKANVTLANSAWTAARLRASLSIDATVVYPPVVATSGASWDDRADAFLAVGRLSPEKDYERLMQILARVRRHTPHITLTIVGTTDRHSRAYYRRLRAVAASLGSWITFRTQVTRTELSALMATHRYGIHGMREEHFGLAPAEMVRAGMIVWVPNGGGQVEIVGEDTALAYESDDEVTEHIRSVMADVTEQQRWLEHLAVRAQRFSTESFVSAVRAVVCSFLG
ncbi:MAG: glycosyltransferase family 4 protein [Acidobacteriota bacterium]